MVPAPVAPVSVATAGPDPEPTVAPTLTLTAGPTWPSSALSPGAPWTTVWGSPTLVRRTATRTARETPATRMQITTDWPTLWTTVLSSPTRTRRTPTLMVWGINATTA